MVLIARSDAANASYQQLEHEWLRPQDALLFCFDAGTGSLFHSPLSTHALAIPALLCGPNSGCRFTRAVRHISWKRLRRMAFFTEAGWIEATRTMPAVGGSGYDPIPEPKNPASRSNVWVRR